MPKSSAANAIKILKNDHDNVKELFDKFENAKDSESKRKYAEEAINELKIHAAVEEKIFYPAARQEIEDSELMNEANEEHHVAKVLIAELDQEKDSETFEAKFTVLAENIRHHVKEEEGEMFSEIKKSEMDLEALGQEIMAMKEQLKSEGVPPTPEEEMVTGGRGGKRTPAGVGS